MKSFVFKLLAGRLGGFIGYRNLVRIGAFLMRAGRNDMPNEIAANGEALVQKVILEDFEGSDAVIIDCGANIGQWSTKFIKSYRAVACKSRIKMYCFEPSSYTYTKLISELGEYQPANLNITTVQKALSSRCGIMGLKVVHDGAGTNSLVAVPGGYELEETVTVITLDQFSDENNLDHIDLLKIDAEGHDFDVILGAEQLLNEQRIGVIQFEYNWRWIYGKHFLQEVFEYFVQQGYSIGKITPKGIQFYECYDVQLESFIEGNYLACTNNWKRCFSEIPSWLDK